MTYILGGGERVDGCLFCEKPKTEDDRTALILHRAEHCFVMLNRYPYNNGHLLVVPYQHASSLQHISRDASAELMYLVQRSLGFLRDLYQPDGFNLGVNEGQAAGAGIAEHVHFHIVPRWAGDSNYVSVLGETRVIPELLEETYTGLRPCYEALARNE
jgi:ATP adenylyltransferase